MEGPFPSLILISWFTGIVALGVLYLLHSQKPLRYSFENLVYTAIGLFILLGLTVPMFRGMLGLASDYFENLTSRATLFITSINTLYLIVIGTIFVLVAKKCLFKGMATKAFVFWAIIVGLCLKLTYIWLIRASPVSDFQTMWRIATETVTAGWPERITSVIQQRALPFFFPLARIFGNSAVVYKMGNVVILLLTSLIGFSLARRWFGESAARASLFLMPLVPETYFSSGIPTHDIPGAFLLLGSLWIFDTALLSFEKKSWITCLLTGLLLGVSVEFLEIQRGLSSIFWPAILIFVCYWVSQTKGYLPNKTDKKMRLFLTQRVYLILLLVVFPFLVSKAVDLLLERNGLILSARLKSALSAFYFMSSSDSWGKGTYSYLIENYGHFNRANGQLRSVAVNKILSDTYYNTFDRVPNYLMRAKSLYRLGSQDYFYYRESILLPSSPLGGKKAARVLTNHNLAFVLFFEIAFIISSVLLLVTKRINPRAFPSALVLSFLSGALLVAGEAQPRHMYPIWFIAPTFIAAQLDIWPILLKKQSKENIKDTVRVLSRCALIFIALACFLFSAILCYAHFSERRYLDLSEWTQYQTGYRDANAGDFFRRIQPTDKGQRPFRLSLGNSRAPEKGDRVSVSHTYQVKDNSTYEFRVYVSPRSRAPDLREASETFSVVILINDRIAERLPLWETRYARLVQIENIIPEHRQIKITLAIETSLNTKDTLGQEASLANFEFAQLLREKR